MASRIRSAAEMLACSRRMIAATGRAVGREDPDALAQLVDLHAQLDDAIAVAIAHQRAQGCTWKWIGESMGVTKEAAIMRWGPRITNVETAL